jgi:hypothetical protein
VHIHVIDVPEGVTLLEFEKNPDEQPPEQEVQAPKEATEEDVVDCPDLSRYYYLEFYVAHARVDA